MPPLYHTTHHTQAQSYHYIEYSYGPKCIPSSNLAERFAKR